MKSLVVVLVISTLFPLNALATEVMSATTEDIEMVDKEIGNNARPEAGKGIEKKGDLKKNIGAQVSKEAKELKEVGEKKGLDFGERMRHVRHEDDKKRLDSVDTRHDGDDIRGETPDQRHSETPGGAPDDHGGGGGH